MRNLFASLFSFIVFNIIWLPFYFPNKLVYETYCQSKLYDWFVMWALFVMLVIWILSIRKLYEIGCYIFDKIKNN